jgi:hypothetical protein
VAERIRCARVALEDHSKPGTAARRAIGNRRRCGTLPVAPGYRHSRQHEQRVSAGGRSLVACRSEGILLTLDVELAHRDRRSPCEKTTPFRHVSLGRWVSQRGSIDADLRSRPRQRHTAAGQHGEQCGTPAHHVTIDETRAGPLAKRRCRLASGGRGVGRQGIPWQG